MEEFVYLIKPVRKDFIKTMTEEESGIMEKHFHYLNALLSDEKLILAGPCLDGAFGIVVFRAETMDAAREIMVNDPAVLHGLMSAEIHPYRVSLIQPR
ncbi:YciI family protein [Heyndrickxia sp. MSNUG]|uniref:YciI family protein n=1 Tax=Heyndrickxia sp. MSNUG TaxID=3136677 RepID=UPI003C2D1AFF